MLTYRPDSERRLRQRLPMFRTATEAAGRTWQLINITTTFERWLESHEYRDEYLQSPDALYFRRSEHFVEDLVAEVTTQLAQADEQTVSVVAGCRVAFWTRTSVTSC